MSMELWQRLKDLEKKVAQIEDRLNKPDIPVVMNITGSSGEPPAKKMSLCPKCGVKPAYFFHVKHCKG